MRTRSETALARAALGLIGKALRDDGFKDVMDLIKYEDHNPYLQIGQAYHPHWKIVKVSVCGARLVIYYPYSSVELDLADPCLLEAAMEVIKGRLLVLDQPEAQ